MPSIPRLGAPERFRFRAKLVLLPAAAIAITSFAAEPSGGAGRVAGLLESLQRAQAQPQPVRFDFSEAEINDYIAFALQRTPRPGLAGSAVKFFPGNYVSTFTTVDFAAVESWHPGTIPAVLKPILSGRRRVLVDFPLAPADGLVRFRVEKAEFEGIAIPSAVVNEVVRVLAARQPEHYDTTKPVPLPFGLKTFWTQPGRVLGQNY
jgi:hypothetical protein